MEENPMQNKKGFTLIELMIVVAIIAILAMIAVPMYQRYIERSRNAAAQSMLQQISTALVAYSVDNQSYPAAPLTGPTVEELMSYGFRPDANVAVEYFTSGSGYVLFAAHIASGSQVYTYDNVSASGVQPMATNNTTEGGSAVGATAASLIAYKITSGSGGSGGAGTVSAGTALTLTTLPNGASTKLVVQ